jgi:outer membrane biosynthesis protein TonB
MRLPLITIIFSLLFSYAAAAQNDIKVKTSVDPTFPAEAASYLYGDKIKVAVEVDKEGKVTKTVARGPMVPCQSLKDPMVDAIRKAAVKAASGTVFEPQMRNGEASKFGVMLTYRLTPRSIPEDLDQPFNARAKSLPLPVYASEARAKGIGGVVEVHVLIDERGSVLSLLPVSGHQLLVGGTIDSACKARFEPPLFSGQPGKVIAKITYRFAPR